MTKVFYATAIVVDIAFLMRQTDHTLACQAARTFGKKKIKHNAYRVLRDPLAVEFYIAKSENELILTARINFSEANFGYG